MAEGEVKAVEQRVLARFPRAPRGKGKPEEIRVVINEHGGEILVSIRTWYAAFDPDEHDDGYKPTRFGIALHANELRAAHAALGEAIRAAESAGHSTEPGEWTPRKRKPPTAWEVRKLRTYAEPLPFKNDEDGIPFESTRLGKSFRPREIWVIEQIKAHDAAKAKGEATQFPDEVMEQGKPSKWDHDDGLPF